MSNKSLNFGSYIPKVLKKIPENPKYKNVKPIIKTGRNVRRLIDDLKEQQINIGCKRDEVFMRIKFYSFVSLAVNVAKLALNPSLILKEDQDVVKEQKVKHERANVLFGIGEIDVRNENNKPPPHAQKPEFQAPYLLLDVRDREQYLESHLKTALHYPPALLSRSIGYEIEEMKQYKNSSNIIILYDHDESVAPKIATTLIERGYNNIYVLTGGWKLGTKAIPKKLWLVMTTDRISSSRLGACGMVQIKEDPGFTNEDIFSIELYVDPVSQGEDEPVVDNLSSRGDHGGGSSRSSLLASSQKDLTSRLEVKDFSERPMVDGSRTYRKEDVRLSSACSLSSAASAARRAPSSGKVKKAPWK